MAYASGQADQPADAQASLYVLRKTSGRFEVTELFLDGSGERITIPPDTTVAYEALIVGRTSGGSSGGYCWRGVVENVGGITTSIGSCDAVLGEGLDYWSVAVVASDAYDALLVEVYTSYATVRWAASVRTVEVAW